MSATPAKLRDAREMLAVDVGEVSLVDRAAILREFAVVKNLEEAPMPAFQPKTVDINKNAGEVKCPSEKCQAVNKAEAAECSKCGGKMAKAEKSKESDKDSDDKGKADEDMEKKLKALAPNANAAQIASAVKMLTEAGVTKSEGGEGASGVTIQISPDGSVNVSGVPVTKARVFTKGRTEAIKAALGGLANILKDVDEEALKGFLNDYVGKGLPESPSVPSQVHAVGTEKGLEAVVAKALAPLVEKIDAQGTRLEKIEKARGAPQSEGDAGKPGANGTTQPAGTQTEVKKSFWSGVLS